MENQKKTQMYGIKFINPCDLRKNIIWLKCLHTLKPSFHTPNGGTCGYKWIYNGGTTCPKCKHNDAIIRL